MQQQNTTITQHVATNIPITKPINKGNITHSNSIQTNPMKDIDAKVISMVNVGINSQAAAQVKQQRNITMLDSIYRHITLLTGKTADMALTIEPTARTHIAPMRNTKTIRRTLKIVPIAINERTVNKTDIKHTVIQHTKHPTGAQITHKITFINVMMQVVPKNTIHVPPNKTEAHMPITIIEITVQVAVTTIHIANSTRKIMHAARHANNRPIRRTITIPTRTAIDIIIHTASTMLAIIQAHATGVPNRMRKLIPIEAKHRPYIAYNPRATTNKIGRPITTIGRITKMTTNHPIRNPTAANTKIITITAIAIHTRIIMPIPTTTTMIAIPIKTPTALRPPQTKHTRGIPTIAAPIAAVVMSINATIIIINIHTIIGTPTTIAIIITQITKVKIVPPTKKQIRPMTTMGDIIIAPTTIKIPKPIIPARLPRIMVMLIITIIIVPTLTVGTAAIISPPQ